MIEPNYSNEKFTIPSSHGNGKGQNNGKGNGDGNSNDKLR